MERSSLYDEEDIDKAYETFLKLFGSLYDKNCPIKQYIKTQNYRDRPWITKGVQSACKKYPI